MSTTEASDGGRRVVVIRNARSGVGNRTRPVDDLVRRLQRDGHAVRVLDAGRELTHERLAGELRASGAQACIVAGGDGTLHYALDALAETGVPVYHMPLGTENLFARQFRMTRDVERVRTALAGSRTSEIDLGVCNGRAFALMFSLGMDSAIVERVASARRAGVRKIDYVLHGLRETLGARIPRVSVRADGQEIVSGRRGLLVVANSRQYAARLDPCRAADMADGLLDVLFFEHSTTLGLAPWLVMTSLGVHTRIGRPVSVRARSVHVHIDDAGSAGGACPWQIDGECVPLSESRSCEITLRPRALRVLAGA